MIVKIWTHKAEKLVFNGELSIVPNKGEFVEFEQEMGCFMVDKVFHFANKNEVAISLCFDAQENLKDIR